MRKNKILLSICLIIVLSACAKQAEVNNENTTEQVRVVKVDSVISKISMSSESKNSFDYKALFEYTGRDKYLKEICSDMVKTATEYFIPEDEKCVEIPTPYIVKIDDSDKNDIKVFGDFYIYGYNMDGSIFVNKNSGSFPGCYHLKEEKNVISVVKKEIAEDGSSFMPSLIKICEGDEALANQVSQVASSDDREVKRIEYVKMYAKNKNIHVTAIKDYGWPIIIFDTVANNEFVFDFYKSYLQEIREEDVLNDMYERLENLKNKYLTAECIKAVDEATEEIGADQIIDAQDVTDDMYNSLTVEEHDNGTFMVKMDMGDDVNRGIEVKLDTTNVDRKISDIKIIYKDKK